MLVVSRCNTSYFLALGVIINTIFICTTQILYFSHYFKKSSSSTSNSPSKTFISVSSNKSLEIERSTKRNIEKGDFNTSLSRFTIGNDISGRNSTKTSNDPKNFQPNRTKEQVKEVMELKEKIGQQMKVAFPKTFNILISPQKLCRPSSERLTLAGGLLAIMVTSHVTKVKVRKIIRQTWADVPEVRSGKVRIVHLLGEGTSEETQNLIRREAEDYDDIIQGSFQDTYNNLTAKTLIGLQWAATCCKNSFKYYMKTDSDVYVNVPQLAKHLAGLGNGELPRAYGRMWVDTKPERLPFMKWFVPVSEYPDPTYPPYLNGPAYVMTSVAVKMVYKEARKTKLVRLEDIFVGICFKKAGVELINEVRFSGYLPRIMTRLCDIHRLFTHHGVAPSNLHHVKAAQDRPHLCVNGTYPN